MLGARQESNSDEFFEVLDRLAQRRLCHVQPGCGSPEVQLFSDGDKLFEKAAGNHGETKFRNYGLVYGGASVGLMAVVADTVLEAGGNVTGVIPEFLVKKRGRKIQAQSRRSVPALHASKPSKPRRFAYILAR